MLPLGRDVANRLFNVMRKGVGDGLIVFNSTDGEYSAEIVEAGKRGGLVKCLMQTRPVQPPPDVWLLFAPIKKDRTEFIVEKAAELGVARIMPVVTEFTQSDRLRVDKLQAHVLAAIEQCGGTFVPQVMEPQKLGAVLDDWPADRQLMFCDEAAEAGVLPTARGAWAVVIGPEGGFSDRERARLAAMGHTVSLGPRILRADTAAVAALTLWQQALGDWS